MDAINYVLAIVVVLGLVFFFHEFGHFITARAFGIRVPVFSFGMGKRLIGFKWGDTDCRLSLIPIGAYVRLEGEPDDGVSGHLETASDGTVARDSRDFSSRPRWQRIIIYLAGPAMNAVLTVCVLTGVYMYGADVDATQSEPPVIGAVEAGSPAAGAGLLPGDQIVAIDGKPLGTWEDAQTSVMLRPEQELRLRVRRGDREVDVPVRSVATPREKIGTIGAYPMVRVGEVIPDGAAASAGLRTGDGIVSVADTPIKTFSEIPTALRGKAGQPLNVRIFREGSFVDVPVVPKDDNGTARIGIGPRLVRKQFGPVRAFVEACRWTVDNVRLTLRVLKGLLTAQLSPKSMMGPIGIAQASGDAAQHGFGPLFMLVAIISLQIGIFNLFPLFPLDGGHLAILASESVLRRDLTGAAKDRFGYVGFAILLMLLGVALYSDLSRTSLLGRFLP